MSEYKIIVRKSPNWKKQTAVTLGISVFSPNWQDKKFESIMEWANDQFSHIRIDVTDTLYKYNFMASGLSPKNAELQATMLGSLWLTRHANIIESVSAKTEIYRWTHWYNHPDFEKVHFQFQNLFFTNETFREAVYQDGENYFNRLGRKPTDQELSFCFDYLIEEVAVATIQSRELSSLKAYPGEELMCMHVIRHGLVKNAPQGLENEQYAKIRIERRQKKTPEPVPLSPKSSNRTNLHTAA